MSNKTESSWLKKLWSSDPQTYWMASAEIQRLESRVRVLEAERDRLKAEQDFDRSAIAWANNSLFGSHGYFLSDRGGPPEEDHLSKQIEKVKKYSRDYYSELEQLRTRHAALVEVAREIYKDACTQGGKSPVALWANLEAALAEVKYNV
jgi:hypothetical protein